MIAAMSLIGMVAGALALFYAAEWHANRKRQRKASAEATIKHFAKVISISRGGQKHAKPSRVPASTTRFKS